MVAKMVFSIALIVIILVGSVLYLQHQFNARLDHIETVIRTHKNGLPRSNLPPEVVALAQRMGARSDAAPSVEFDQSGTMWMSRGAKATPFSAHQIVGVSTPAFAWRAALDPVGAVLVADYFSEGTGGLEVKLFGAVTLARMVGTPGMNQGEMLRYLAEVPWNPDAILMNELLDWTVVDPQTIRVASGVGEDRGEITFNLNADGLIHRMSAPSRVYADKGRMTALPWHGRFWDHQKIGGRLLPLQGEVAWVIEGDEFVYWRGRLLNWK
jgi:hypothetical protein